MINYLHKKNINKNKKNRNFIMMINEKEINKKQ